MNNFDTSSSGVNLELSVFWDNDLSRHYFDESFHILQYSDRTQNSILVFNWFGNTDQSGFELYDLNNYKYTKKDLISALIAYYGEEDLKSKVKDNFEVYLSEVNKNQLEELFNFDIDNESQKELVEQYLTPNYQTLTSTGYCQGDYSEIIFTKSLLDQIRKELTSCKNKTDQEIADYFQDDIDHLLWDSPLYARLDINDNEFYLDDFQKDRYTYDKYEIITHVKNNLKHEKLNYIVEWLGNNLPDQPDYK